MLKNKKELNNYYKIIDVTHNWLMSLKCFDKFNSWLVCSGILYSVFDMIYKIAPGKKEARSLIFEAVKHFENENKI